MWLNDEFGMLNDEFSPAAIRSFEWLNKIGCTSSNSNKFDYFRFAQSLNKIGGTSAVSSKLDCTRFAQSFSLRFDVELFSVE